MFDPRPLYCSSLNTAVGGTKDTNIVDSESPYRGTNQFLVRVILETHITYPLQSLITQFWLNKNGEMNSSLSFAWGQATYFFSLLEDKQNFNFGGV